MLLVETKNVDTIVQNLAQDLGYKNSFVISANGSSGGAAFFWSDRVKINFLDSPSLYCTHMSVENETNVMWLSYIYGNPDVRYRKEQWNDLIKSEHAGFLQNKPRLMVGDFNDIKNRTEKQGGLLRSVGSFSLFNHMISVLGLHDIKSIGGKYIWIGKRSRYSIMTRIDRAMANCEWLERYPSATVTLLPWIGSDHRPLLLDTEGSKWKKPKIFRYDPRWRLYPDVKQVIEQVLEQEEANVSIGDMYSIIRDCRKALSKWRSKHNMNSEKLITKLKKDIQDAYKAPSIDYVKLTNLKAQLQLQYRLEEEYWRTKSRILWLQAGDRNTKYFHAKVKQRRSYNRIIFLQDEKGKVYKKAKDIFSHIQYYFSHLFPSSGSIISSSLMEGIPRTVTEEINSRLTEPITEMEVKKAVFAMNPDKTPGPDGMSAAFYRQHWEAIKTGVFSCVQNFFENNYLDPRLNETHICLIPKIENPLTIKDYRPISLANVVYKIISKILAERLKPWLNSIIIENQSAFIPGRLITDNVLIAHELMHSLNTKNLKNKFMAVKLDIAKAFDKVEWRFVDAVMEKMGFCQQWRQWIMTCITTVSYSVLINGEQSKIIKPQRGIRQGDPISPYLYIICTEGLSRLIKQNIKKQMIHGFKASRSGPPVSHLLFADDSLLFCKATEEEARNMAQILNTYQRASGQEINYTKSAISFGKGTPKYTQDNIIKHLGITKIGGFGKYLGLPECIGKNRRETFQYIIQRIENKMVNWYSKFLSPAGKEILLKAVITALPTYTMSCFLLPKNLVKEITKAMRQFWWSANLDKRSIPWIAWDKITLSKKEGGLGVRDMLAFNKALLAKQAWRLMNNPTSLLARVYKAKYFRKTNFLEAKASPSSSYAWRSIIQTQSLISKGIKWIVGNGENIRLWKDNWLQGDTDLFPTSPGAELYPMMMVKDLFISGTREWDISKIRSLVREEDVAKNLRIRPSWTLQQDTLCWRFGTTGTYTVKTGYHLQRSMDIEAQPNQSSNQPQVTLHNNLLNKLWRVNIPPKIKMFWWKATHNGLPVVENLKKRGYGSCELCPLCGEKPETVDHMILQCRIAWEIWSLVLNEDRYQLSQISTIYDLMLFCLQKISKDRADNVPFFLGWRIWKARNKLVFENRRDHIIHIINSAYMDAKIWKEALTQNKET